jgi:hypothetical protein
MRLLCHARRTCASKTSTTQKQAGNLHPEDCEVSSSREHRPCGMPLNPSPPTESLCPDCQRRFNTHSPAASAANAGGFLQTSLSEVTRRPKSPSPRTITRRVTPDRVIAFTVPNPRKRSESSKLRSLFTSSLREKGLTTPFGGTGSEARDTNTFRTGAESAQDRFAFEQYLTDVHGAGRRFS